MRWTPKGRSIDVEDRRGQGGGGGRSSVGRLGIGGVVVLAAMSLLFQQDFFTLLEEPGGAPGDVRSLPSGGGDTTEEPLVQFVSFVLDDAQATWAAQLEARGRGYERAKLVLFTDNVRSACGHAEAAMGPFYCAQDERVYVDLGFYRELERRFGATGDFAQAYVIAHEIGHHVQHELGLDRERARLETRTTTHELSVRYELQADCFAGIWAHSTSRRDLLEPDDVEEALAAAAAIGDDRIQERAGARVNPETWTHGSSAQRLLWFRRGLETGRIEDCDTSQ